MNERLCQLETDNDTYRDAIHLEIIIFHFNEFYTLSIYIFNLDIKFLKSVIIKFILDRLGN